MTFDPNKIRKDFPQLQSDTLHYLDAATTSYAPQQVLDAQSDYHARMRSRSRPSFFGMTAPSPVKIYKDARKKVAAFINAEPDEITFTSGATESSNMLARMVDESLYFVENKELVSTVLEHDGALTPLRLLARNRDMTLHMIPLDGVLLDHAKIEEVVSDDTALISFILASHVTGGLNDAHQIAALAHDHGALAFVDATSSAGRIPIDVRKLDCDALYFSAHKMLGTIGVGVLWVRRGLIKKPHTTLFGLHMISSIENLSAKFTKTPTPFGTQEKNMSGVVSLSAALDYLNMLGVEHIHAHTEALIAYAIKNLEMIPGVTVVAERDTKKNIGIVSFYCTWSDPHKIAEFLLREHVHIRAGNHNASSLHGALGVTATLRASFHCYSTKADVDALVLSLQRARQAFVH